MKLYISTIPLRLSQMPERSPPKFTVTGMFRSPRPKSKSECEGRGREHFAVCIHHPPNRLTGWKEGTVKLPHPPPTTIEAPILTWQGPARARGQSVSAKSG